MFTTNCMYASFFLASRCDDTPPTTHNMKSVQNSLHVVFLLLANQRPPLARLRLDEVHIDVTRVLVGRTLTYAQCLLELALYVAELMPQAIDVSDIVFVIGGGCSIG
jgi:hypothetical protein